MTPKVYKAFAAVTLMFCCMQTAYAAGPSSSDVVNAFKSGTNGRYDAAEVQSLGCSPNVDGERFLCGVSVRTLSGGILMTNSYNIQLKKGWFGYSLEK